MHFLRFKSYGRFSFYLVQHVSRTFHSDILYIVVLRQYLWQRKIIWIRNNVCDKPRHCFPRHIRTLKDEHLKSSQRSTTN